MHIGNNVTKTLWPILDGRRDKENIVKIFNEIKEAYHAFQSVIHSNRDGDNKNIITLPGLLTKQQRRHVKEVIENLNFQPYFLET